MNVEKFTDEEKAIIFDYLYNKLKSFKIECEEKRGTIWGDVQNIDMSLLVVEWVQSIMEDYHTARVMTAGVKE